ncbi:Surfeit locus 1/Shy1 [Artemisia annua]|uniref:SURF1-like protein n=1 Tax=Artemisia annua TaxID=35608 RepID=A0A2U1PKQ2_ARTAN|nr:Surfeit locus 1/Shy1 [Artemisia annua]
MSHFYPSLLPSMFKLANVVLSLVNLKFKFRRKSWNIEELQSSEVKMLEYKKSRLEMEPINCNYITPSGENIDSLEFRRVMCKGVYDETKSIFVGPRSRSISGVTENGYYLITPLMPVSGSNESVKFFKCQKNVYPKSDG